MASLTRVQLRDQIGFAADVTIQTTGRYTAAMVNDWIQSAAHEYALARAEYAPSLEKYVLLTGTSSATPALQTFPGNQILQLPADFLRLRAAFTVDGTSRRQLQFLAESDRWDESLLNVTLYTEYACRVVELADGTKALRLWPALRGTTTIEVVYTPGASTLSDTSPAGDWLYDAGCEDLLICDVAMKLLGRDAVPENSMYQELMRRREEARERLKRTLCPADQQGVPAMRDTRSRVWRRW